ncbi:cathepsin L-like [Atheta coriaria]|uniref:cathepsin L-like n=1 Tax=Dalotia coriaria TaxID=877792 RepID=UPI0031F43A59
MKSLVILVAILRHTLCGSYYDEVTRQWGAYLAQEDKQYDSETEEKFRMKVFMENAHKVIKHNQLYDIGLVNYKLSLNTWSDMLHHEFIHIVNGYNRTLDPFDDTKEGPVAFIPPAHVCMPKEVDWRTEGAVTHVKDQKQCGSCWSFSATGALEGQHFRKTSKLVSLSEQNLVDCSTKYGNHGCNGGNMDNAFRYIKDNKGIDTEEAYPYEAKDQKCAYNAKKSGAITNGFVDLPKGNEEALMQAVATIGPIAIAIDASQETFQHYSKGVYYEPKCKTEDLDHAVLAVGYGTTENGEDFGW